MHGPFLPAEARPDVTTELARKAWQVALALHALRAADHGLPEPRPER
ncbi:hypothetical protein [Streptomyces sp. S.PNR 29]|nr:hypothetical protein [Streptomyces sp. S.PNR 29]MDN0198734.1 hypothetical protein [Streptomyces sp. S.PNR 29]